MGTIQGQADRLRSISPRTAYQTLRAVHDSCHRVVAANVDRAVVNQEQVGDPLQAIESVAVVNGDGLVRPIAAGHDERNATNGFEQKVVERCVREHDAECGVSGGDPLCDARTGSLVQQHDGSPGRREQRLFGRGCPAVRPRRFNIANHDGKGFFIAVFPLPKRRDCGFRTCIAGEMKAAEAFECTDRSGAKRRGEMGQWIVGFDSLALSIQELKLRPAGWAGRGLGMKSPVRGIFVLGPAFGAHAEWGHGGALAVIGGTRDDRQPRSAVGAIEKRIMISAIMRVEQLGQAVVTSGHIGRYEDRTACVALAGFDSEIRVRHEAIAGPMTSDRFVRAVEARR